MTDFYAEALRGLDILDGTLRPEIVDVQDGFYTRKLVLDEVPVASFLREGSELPGDTIKYHYEPCRIRKTRPEIVWVRG